MDACRCSATWQHSEMWFKHFCQAVLMCDILQARVPIIKYHQDLTGLEYGLSMTNMYIDLQYSSVILMYVK